jgi:hypothetical protein
MKKINKKSFECILYIGNIEIKNINFKKLKITFLSFEGKNYAMRIINKKGIKYYSN